MSSSIMSLSSWSSLSSCLHLDSSGWLQSSSLYSSMSQSTLLLASSTSSSVVLVDKERGARLIPIDTEFSASVEDSDLDKETVSAVSLIALNCPQTLSKATHAQQSVIVLGFTSGLVTIMSTSGHLLFGRRLSGSSVRSLRGSRTSLSVVHKDCVVVLDLPQLMELLNANAKLAARASSGLMSLDEYVAHVKSSALSLKSKKWLSARPQDLHDVAVVSHRSSAFERWQVMSYEGNAVNENSLRVFNEINQLICVGANPCFRFNSVYSVRSKDFNELAESVVGSVKSGLARMFFASSRQANQEPEETVHKFNTLHEYYDVGKCVKQVEVAPNNLYLAMRDEAQHRIMVIDALKGFIIQLWKGYHHVQMAWVTVKEENNANTSVTTCLLAIYIPRRGSLELWTVERKLRLVEFEVSKHGLLLSSNDNSNDVVFIDKEGEWHSIIVPKEALSSNAQREDLVMEQTLIERLRDPSKSTKASDVIAMLSETKSVTSKITMLISCMQEGSLTESEMRTILRQCEANLKETRDKLGRDLNEDDKKVVTQEGEDVDNVESSSSLSLMENCIRTLVGIVDFHVIISIDGQKKEETSSESKKAEEELSKPSEEDMGDKEAEKKKVEERNVVEVLMILKCNETDMAILKPLLFASKESSSTSMSLQATSNQFNLSSLSLSTKNVEDRCKALLKTEANKEVFNGLLNNSSSSLSSSAWSSSLSADSLMKFTLNSWMATKKHDLKETLNLSSLINAIYHLTTKDNLNGLTSEVLQQVHTDFPMSYSMGIFLFVLKHFLASVDTSVLNSELVEETQLRLDLCLKFLKMQRAFEERHPTVVANWGGYTMNKMFGSDGSVVDEIAKWIVMTDYDFNFVGSCANVFPLSCRSNTLLSHVIWVSFEEWKRNRRIEYLNKTAFYLERLAKDSLWLSHQLSLILYRSALERLGVEIVSVCESPSEAKCVRDVGVGLDDLSNTLQPLLRIVSNLLNELEREDSKNLVAPQSVNRADFYDDIGSLTSSSKRQLIDHVLHASSRQHVDTSLLGLQLQFFIVAALIAHFKRLGNSTKPLQLFNVQESNSFFQTGHHNAFDASLAILNVTQNHVVRGARRRFLSETTLAIVESIVFEMNEAGERVAMLDQYELWLQWLMKLADLWHVTDKTREVLANHLFRLGHDALGYKVLSSLDHSHHVQSTLLHVAMSRISKLVFESEHEELNRHVVRMKPSLAEKLSEFQSEAASLPLTNVSDTQALLIHICNHTDEKHAQMALELLSVIKTFAVKVREEDDNQS